MKRNLMVFIHPVILADRSSGATESNAKYLRMREQQLEFRERVQRYLLPRELPVLPDLVKPDEATRELEEINDESSNPLVEALPQDKDETHKNKNRMGPRR